MIGSPPVGPGAGGGVRSAAGAPAPGFRCDRGIARATISAPTAAPRIPRPSRTTASHPKPGTVAPARTPAVRPAPPSARITTKSPLTLAGAPIQHPRPGPLVFATQNSTSPGGTSGGPPATSVPSAAGAPRIRRPSGPISSWSTPCRYVVHVGGTAHADEEPFAAVDPCDLDPSGAQYVIDHPVQPLPLQHHALGGQRVPIGAQRHHGSPDVPGVVPLAPVGPEQSSAGGQQAGGGQQQQCSEHDGHHSTRGPAGRRWCDSLNDRHVDIRALPA